MSEIAADATAPVVDPNICPECGYEKDSRTHLEGRGLHGHFATVTTDEELTEAAIRRLTHSALVAYAQARGHAAEPGMTKGDIYELLGMARTVAKKTAKKAAK